MEVDEAATAFVARSLEEEFAPYGGYWRIVWTHGDVEGFCEARALKATLSRRMRTLFQGAGAETSFSLVDGCFLEEDVSGFLSSAGGFLSFGRSAALPVNGGPTAMEPHVLGLRGCTGQVSLVDGELRMVETPGDCEAGSEIVHRFARHGEMLYREVSWGAKDINFTIVMARVDDSAHHRSRVLRAEIDKAPGTRGPLALMPAACFFPVWLYCMARRRIWAAVFGEFWPMSLAMVVGSFIAGSTPLGGGVVGFPVAVLVLGMEPAQGRDFSAMIQAVGMTSASYLIMYLKPELVHAKLVAWSIAFGVLGCIVGFVVPVDPFAVNLTLTTYLLAFAVVYFYKNEVVEALIPPSSEGGRPPDAPSKGGPAAAMTTATAAMAPRHHALRDGALAASALLGGFVTAKLGSGSDSMAYIFASFCWNLLSPPEEAISESAMTASTVIVMATMSFVVVGIRMATGAISQDVVYCWCAAAPVVCFGAPLGSLVLGPRAELVLRRFFYVISAVQFLFFALIVIRTHVVGWSVVATCLGATAATVLAHYKLRLVPAAAALKSQNSPRAPACDADLETPSEPEPEPAGGDDRGA